MIAAIAVAASLLADAFVFAAYAEFTAAAYDGAAPHAIGWWAFALVAVAGFVVPRFVAGWELSARRAYLFTALPGLALIYLLIRIEVAGDVAIWDFSWATLFIRDATAALEGGGRAIVGTLLLALTWARASYRAGDEIAMETLPKWATLPFLVAIAIVVAGAATDRSGEVGRAGAAFFALAVIALAGSQLSLSGQTFGDLRAGSATVVLLAATTGVAAVGLVVFTVVAPIAGPIIGPVISRLIEVTLTILLTPFAWIVQEIVQFLMQDAKPLEDLSEGIANRRAEAAEGEPGDPSTAGQMAVYLLRVLALAAMAGLIVGITVLYARVRRRQAARALAGPVAGASGNLGDDLRGWFRSLVARGGGNHDAGNSEAARLYLEVVERAEHEGYPRPGGTTPREYLPQLQNAFATNVTDEITFAFEEARYAGREPDARVIEELRRRWRDQR